MKTQLKRLLKTTAVRFASRFGAHTRAQTEPKLWVLMYHRVLPKHDFRYNLEEPGMIVTPDTFSMHIQEINRHFDVISLNEWVKLKQQGLPLPAKACAVTFDDGWADNYEYAFPILKATKTPATLFAVAEKIGTDFQFWPNIVLALLLNDLRAKMDLHPLFAKVTGLMAELHTSINREYAAAYIAQLKGYSDSDIFSALSEINSAELLAGKLPHALMSWEQLTEMQTSGLVDIGSHTCNHKRLSTTLSNDELHHEIRDSKLLLEEKLASPIDLFCFPNGDYNNEVLNLVKNNYLAAVTTKRGIVTANSSLNHELTRIGLHEEVSHSRQLFGARLSGWL